MGKINMKFATVLLLALLAIFAVVESSRLRKGHRRGRRHRRSDIQLKTDLKMISTYQTELKSTAGPGIKSLKLKDYPESLLELSPNKSKTSFQEVSLEALMAL